MPGNMPPAAASYTPAPSGQSWPVPAAPNVAYAGFWLRLVAAIIDGLIISIPLAPVYILIFFRFLKNTQDLQNLQDPATAMTTLGSKLFLLVIIGLIAVLVGWVYHGLFESSTWQGTPGKKALGLMVTDMEGRRVTFGRASGRFFAGRGATLIPSLGGLYYVIDCICIGFTEKKQAIHDMIASCLVLRKL
ncbi:MAG TPA: RDD family protein [Candidatus Acidoferrales bacterium]